MHFVDSHVHLCEYPNRRSPLNQARFSGAILASSGIDKATSLATIAMARNEPAIVKAFVGVHPSAAQAPGDLEWFGGALREASGAGELGLDPRYSEVAPRTPQMIIFVQQLEAAEKEGKPVQVHSRGAEKECLEVLSSYRLGNVLMHWFEGEGELGKASDEGFFFSFGPAILYSKKLQRMALSLDPKRVLAESDGPVTFRPLGGAGGPALIPSVVFKLAELWGVPFAEAGERLWSNGLSFLGPVGKT